MSPKSKKVWHFKQYVSFTGWFALCRADNPELDSLPAHLTKDVKKVNCKECMLELLQ